MGHRKQAASIDTQSGDANWVRAIGLVATQIELRTPQFIRKSIDVDSGEEREEVVNSPESRQVAIEWRWSVEKLHDWLTDRQACRDPKFEWQPYRSGDRRSEVLQIRPEILVWSKPSKRNEGVESWASQMPFWLALVQRDRDKIKVHLLNEDGYFLEDDVKTNELTSHTLILENGYVLDWAAYDLLAGDSNQGHVPLWLTGLESA